MLTVALIVRIIYLYSHFSKNTNRETETSLPITPTPSNSLFAPLPSHWILRRVLTDRVTRMAKMKRTRKGGLNLFDKIFPECFVRFKGGEQQRYKAKIQPRNRMDSLSSSLAFSFHEPCHFMTVLFLFTSDSVPSRTLNNTAI